MSDPIASSRDTMSSLRPALSLRPLAPALLALLALAGCASQTRTPEQYQPRQSPTLSDAQRHAQGRETGRAPAQLQLGFGDTAVKPVPSAQPAQGDGAQAADAAQPPAETPAPALRALAEPKTFLGTVPCQGGACQAARISLTIAPSGHWRARTAVLAPQPSSSTEQGCWEVVSTQPPRIILLAGQDVIRANLGFVNDNVLRVHEINGTQPALEYRLTRQADIDPIDEMKGKPLPTCKVPVALPQS